MLTRRNEAKARSPKRGAGRTSLKFAATAVVLAALGALAGAATFSGFNDTTTNPANSFSAGSVSISNNTSGSSMMAAITNGKPGDTTSGCVNVTYGGSLPANVRLYGSTSGTGLDAYLDVKVTRGTIPGSPAAGSCTGFTADTTDYVGSGAGVIFSNTLNNWPHDAATAIVDPKTSSPATWSNGNSHAYKIQVTVRDDVGGEGKNATQTFTWEARNQ